MPGILRRILEQKRVKLLDVVFGDGNRLVIGEDCVHRDRVTGDLLFVSGQIGTRLESGAPVLVAGGIEPETRQTLDNIRAIVERAGTSMDRVVKCMVMLADMADWPRVNEIYATYFPGPKPARSAFGATGLALGARVEIECTAKVD